MADWGRVDIAASPCSVHTIGECTMWIRILSDEWAIAYEYNVDPDDDSSLECRDELNWIRYVSIAGDTLEICPTLPDRPVVIRPASPIVLLPGRWGRFFLNVPVWIRFVSDPDARRVSMTEIPSRKLSSTWFGSTASGELSYAIDARLRRSADEVENDPSYATCGVEIRNASKGPLQFERISVHVEHMHLFRSDGRLWTNEVKVVYRGADQVSQLDFGSKPPSVVTESDVVSQPRLPLEKNLLKKSFDLIREITGM